MGDVGANIFITAQSGGDPGGHRFTRDERKVEISNISHSTAVGLKSTGFREMCDLSLDQGTRAEVRRLLQQLRRVRPISSRGVEKVTRALLISWLSGGKVDLALSFLRPESRAERASKRCKRQEESLSPPPDTASTPPEGLPAAWATALTDRWAQWSVDDEVDALMTSAGKLQRARNFGVSWELREWVQEQNKRALAPTGVLVCRKQRELTRRALMHREPVLPLASDQSRRTTRKWVSRWSKTQGLQKGKFKAGVCLSLEAARKKAAFCVRHVLKG